MSIAPPKFEKSPVAWTHPHEAPKENYIGLVGFIVSVVSLVFTLGFLSPIGLLISLAGLFARPRGYAVAGVITGLLGSLIPVALGVMFFLAVAVGAPMVQGALNEFGDTVVTASAIMQAKEKIEDYRKENERLPEGIEGNKLIAECKDVKGNSVRYEVTDGGYALRSAGKDGKFETEDDITDSKVEAYVKAIEDGTDMSREEIEKIQKEIQAKQRADSRNAPEIEIPEIKIPEVEIPKL
jgi:hypothetical protein